MLKVLKAGPQVLLPDFEYHNGQPDTATSGVISENDCINTYTKVIIDMICEIDKNKNFIPILDCQPLLYANHQAVSKLYDSGPHGGVGTYFREFIAYTYTYGLDGRFVPISKHKQLVD